MCRALVAAFLLAVLALSPAAADPPGPARVTLRVGVHGTVGRVVFVVPRGVIGAIVSQDDGTVRVVLAGAGAVPGSVRGTRNVVAIDGGNDAAVLVLARGSHPVLWQHAGRVVVDVYGPGPAAVATPAIAAPPAVPPPVVPPPKPAQTVAPGALPSPPPAAGLAAASPPAVVAPVQAAPLGPPADSVPTDGLVAARVPADAAGGGDAILVPFDREVAAAAFARGDLAHVVFDDSKPVDLAELKDDPVFAGARVSLLPAATDLTLRLAAGKRLRLHRRPNGWVVAVVPQAGDFDSASVKLSNGIATIATPQAAATVVMDDPLTGARLLIGTVRAEGAAVMVPHRSPDFTLLRSWAGVALLAQSDRLALRATKAGFTLATASGPPLADVTAGDAEQALAEAGTLTRHFDLAPLPLALRRARFTNDMAAVAAAPRLARFRPRLRAAQNMLALGLDNEAASVLRLAVREDPSQAQNADAAALLAMADWLAGRGDGAALAAPAMGASDEMALWRAVLRPDADGRAAATLAGNWRLLLAYPEALRRRLLPRVADIMLKGGQRAAAAALLAKVADPLLDGARAEALRLDGKTAAALALLDGLADGRDRRVAADARRDAIELRLATGAMTPAAAAEALDKHLYDWRDDAREADLRLRIAALRSQAGDWRTALALLRETEGLFPARHDQVHVVERQVIADLLASSAAARLAPLDLVALVEENADLLAEKGASETLAPVLVDKLLALDLPDRADPILAKLMAATGALEAKAVLGARLAGLRLDQGDSTGAKAALLASDATGLTAPTVAHRAVLQARALLLDGAEDGALALLTAHDSPEALDMRARLLEKRHDWRQAELVLQALVRSSLPATGTLTDAQQDLLLRLASAASEAGDMALMQQLQSGDARRLTAGPRAQLFQALATRPVTAIADLPRSGREAAAARTVPAALASYDPR
jgi:hypothetical protein